MPRPEGIDDPGLAGQQARQHLGITPIGTSWRWTARGSGACLRAPMVPIEVMQFIAPTGTGPWRYRVFASERDDSGCATWPVSARPQQPRLKRLHAFCLLWVPEYNTGGRLSSKL
jgi:hypothetical protein